MLLPRAARLWLWLWLWLCFAALSLLPAACGGTAGGVTTADADDATSFVQVPRRRVGSCTCLAWTEAYKSHGVTCGQGFEFSKWLHNSQALDVSDVNLNGARALLGDQYCKMFFERMTNNFGVRKMFNTPVLEHGKDSDSSWCYVSSDCEELGGGARVPNTTASWKLTKKGEDMSLSDLTPDALIKVSASEADGGGYDLGYVVGYAYYLTMLEDPEEVGDDVVQQAAATGLTTVLQPARSLSPRMVVSGSDRWKLFVNTGYQSAAPGSWWSGFKVDSALASKQKQQEEQAREPCACMAWEDVYRFHGVTCGQGLELFAWLSNNVSLAASDSRLVMSRASLGNEFCTHFFERMKNNYGVRMKFNTKPEEVGKVWDASWCYVSDKCKDPHTAHVPETGVNVKIIQKGQDLTLGDLEPQALLDLAATEGSGYDLGVISGFSYYRSLGKDPKVVSDEMVQQAAASGLTTVLEPAWHLNPRMIVKGSDQWKFEQNTGHASAARPGTWWAGSKLAPAAARTRPA